jgi:hypothetical protein
MSERMGAQGSKSTRGQRGSTGCWLATVLADRGGKWLDDGDGERGKQRQCERERERRAATGLCFLNQRQDLCHGSWLQVDAKIQVGATYLVSEVPITLVPPRTRMLARHLEALLVRLADKPY